MTTSEQTRSRKFSLAWLKPPPASPDGNMTLFEHLRELRYRVVLSSIVIVVGAIVCGIFYKVLLDLMLIPWHRALANLAVSHPSLDTSVVTSGPSAPFLLAMKVALLGGLLSTAPVWLYQLWAFIVPGLLSQEKKYAVIFLAFALPLFFGGVILGWAVMPMAISIMLSFTPENQSIVNLVDMNEFLSFMIRMMLMFGIAFLVPLVIVMLNLIGVIRGVQLGKARNIIIFSTFVVSALVTPADPISMIALAVPLSLLFIAAEVFCRMRDRSLRRRGLLVDAS